ncbi:MAG: PBSX family phage terminase large subunit [Ilumatobacteraceae bacterium]|jgi:PBSX family phage terminase large subunit|nr:PBSX family phage terminase large subunit [Ilumatobacteraceae bacterium]
MTLEDNPRPLSSKQRVFADEYLKCFNASEAARRAGYTGRPDVVGPRLLVNVGIKAIVNARIAKSQMSADEALKLLAEQGRATIGTFFKIVEEWTFYPLPTYEIIDAKEVIDDTNPDKPVTRISYWVRHIAIDLDKVIDPGYSGLLQEFSDSPKDGVTIKIYNKQTALDKILRVHGKYKDNENPNSDQANTLQALPSLPADLIAPDFLNVYRDIKAKRHTEYVLKGGRGSTKSSFVGLVFIYLLVNNPNAHALALRQVKDTLRDSVYGQFKWAINELGLTDSFKCTLSPLEIEYIPTHQKIYFRGADDPANIKSIKPPFGHIGFLWFEELDQFHGPEAVRNIVQSALRGGEEAFMFKSFNPPRTSASWVNKYCQIPKTSQYQHHSSYLTVPREWLGKPWIEEAEHLKEVNPKAYDHEYLGIANGTGGTVFENVTIRKITNEEITQFDHVLHGLDFGYYPDPLSYGRMHYDAARMTLYIFDEYRVNKASNRSVYDALVSKGLNPDDLVIADSAEPKSIADFREYGATIRGAEKGPDSVSYSMKWLQSLKAIVIDNERAPEHAEEFLNYELEQDKNGEIISAYPDKNNHAIDDVRYATNLIWRRRGA